MVDVKIDDVEFRIKQEHDFSWLCSLGRESYDVVMRAVRKSEMNAMFQ